MNGIKSHDIDFSLVILIETDVTLVLYIAKSWLCGPPQEA